MEKCSFLLFLGISSQIELEVMGELPAFEDLVRDFVVALFVEEQGGIEEVRDGDVVEGDGSPVGALGGEDDLTVVVGGHGV